MTGFQNANSAGFPTQDQDSGRRKENKCTRKDGIRTPPLPKEEELSKGRTRWSGVVKWLAPLPPNLSPFTVVRSIPVFGSQGGQVFRTQVRPAPSSTQDEARRHRTKRSKEQPCREDACLNRKESQLPVGLAVHARACSHRRASTGTDTNVDLTGTLRSAGVNKDQTGPDGRPAAARTSAVGRNA